MLGCLRHVPRFFGPRAVWVVGPSPCWHPPSNAFPFPSDAMILQMEQLSTLVHHTPQPAHRPCAAPYQSIKKPASASGNRVTACHKDPSRAFC